MNNQSEIARAALNEFGVPLEGFCEAIKAATYKTSCDKLNAFKMGIRAKYKQLAKENHPDIGGDEESMKRINSALDIIMRFRVEPPRPVIQVRHVFTTYAYTNTATSSTTGGYSYYG